MVASGGFAEAIDQKAMRDEGSAAWTDKPTQAGRYQYRYPQSSMIVFPRVERTQTGGLVATIQGLDYLELEQLPGQWRVPMLDGSPGL